MKRRNIFSLAGISLLSFVILSACGGKSSSEGVNLTSFPLEVEHEGEVIEGGQLKYALVSAANSTGLLMDELAGTHVDTTFASFADETLFGYDGDRKLDDSGLAKVEFDLDKNTAKVSIQSKEYKWSDGFPFTIDDYIFTLTAMSHPDYTGIDFNEHFRNIKGVDEYNAGQAVSISGLEKIDDYTVLIHFKNITPSMQYAGSAVPHYLTPKHIFESIPVKDWETSEYARSAKFVGLGPFKVKEVISGESITYEANEYYFKGKPKIDSIKVDIVSPDTIVSEMKAGNYDIADMPSEELASYKNLSNLTLLGKMDAAYEYVAFNLGTYDKINDKSITDSNAKMSDPKLRQAIGYALDTEQAAKSLYNGLYHRANSLLISYYGDLHDSDLEGFTYNPEKAKQLLDEAGYKDVDGDGIREDKNGKEFKISFGVRTRTNANETLAQQYITWWKEVGLNVELYTGRTIESNTLFEMVQSNDPNLDMYAGGFATGNDPNPSEMWGPVSAFNLTRYTSDENTRLLQALNSKEAFDEQKNKEAYYAWQKNANEEAFAIPTFEIETVTAVNKRVKHYDLKIGSASKSSWELIELTAEKGQAD